MELKIPKELESTLAEMREKIKNRAESAKRSEQKEIDRLAKIEALRQSRRAELLAYAQDIFSWKELFEKTTVYHDLFVEPGWKLFEGIPLFIGKFWRGEPIPKSVITDCAVAGLLANHRQAYPGHTGPATILYYAEYSKANRAFRIEIGSAQDLVQIVHPDFLQQFHAHLAGPDAFRYVAQEVERASRY